MAATRKTKRFPLEPIRTDFSGYEGMYVAIDALTGKKLYFVL